MVKNKKASKTYALVYRPRDDPLYGNPDVSPYVLMRVSKQKKERKQLHLEEQDPWDYRLNNHNAVNTKTEEWQYDQRDFLLGEYNLDLKSYDYTQHLKEVNPVEENFPQDELEKHVSSPIFEIIQQVKTRTGQYIGVDMAAREWEARKQLERDRQQNEDLDKVLELLEAGSEEEEEEETEEKDSIDEELQDDFVLIANGEQLPEKGDLQTETEKSKYEEPKLSYKVMNQVTTEQKQLLEKKFEHFYASLYDSEEDHMEDSSEAPESFDIESSLQFTKERIEKLTKDLAGCSLDADSNSDKEKAKNYEEDEEYSSEDDILDSDSLYSDSLEETESTLNPENTTANASTTTNTPHLIGADFRRARKTNQSSSTTNIQQRDKSSIPVEPVNVYRNKNETREEKKMRKKAVKEWKAFRRAEKSDWKKLFRQERQRQAKQIARSGTGRVFLETVNG